MLAGAFSCHHLNAHRNDEYIVPGASDGDVTETACPGRILLVEQQVSLSLLIRDRNRHTSDFPRRTSGKEAALLSPPPLRTARESFDSSRSSLSNAILGTRFRYGQT